MNSPFKIKWSKGGFDPASVQTANAIKLTSSCCILNPVENEWWFHFNRSLGATAQSSVCMSVFVGRAKRINSREMTERAIRTERMNYSRARVCVVCVYICVFISTSSRWAVPLPWRAAWWGPPRTRQQWSPLGSVRWTPEPLVMTRHAGITHGNHTHILRTLCYSTHRHEVHMPCTQLRCIKREQALATTANNKATTRKAELIWSVFG